MDSGNATASYRGTEISSSDVVNENFTYSILHNGNSTTTNETYHGVDEYEIHIVVSLTVIYAFVFILGLTGNGLVIYSIKCCRKLHNVTCVLLANLAAADLILIVCVLPFKLATSFITHWVFGAAVCRLLPYLQVLSPACSIFTMVAISVERFYAVIYPLRAKSVLTLGRAKRVVIILWVVSTIYSIPAFYSKNLTRQSFDGYEETIPNCNDGWPGATIEQAYAVYLFIFIFAVPLIIVSYCYIRVIIALQWSTAPENMYANEKTNKKVNKSTSLRCVSDNHLSKFVVTARWQPDVEESGITSAEESDACLQGKVYRGTKEITNSRIVYEVDKRRSIRRDEKRKVILMLVLVVLLFVFLWGPVLTYNVFLRFGLASAPNDWTTWRISVALHLMAYFNSCTNPLVYFFVSKHFRDSFLTVMFCRVEDSGHNEFQMGSNIGRSKGVESKVTMLTSPKNVISSGSHV